MSSTPTPSMSSAKSQYYDAPDMHHLDDHAGEGSGSSQRKRERGPVPPDGTTQFQRAEETGFASRHVRDDAEEVTPSLRSLPIEPSRHEEYLTGAKTTYGRPSSAVERKGSVRTAHTSGSVSAFANGAPLIGPNAEPNVDETLFVRSARAERSLSQKQKDRITREEKRESKKFSRLLKTESTTEKVALDSSLKTLSSLQGLHKDAIKRETKAAASHARALSAAQKAESRFQEEKARTAEMRARAEARCIEEHARWQGKEGEVRAQQERLDSARESVKETEVRIADCAREVERLRIVKAADEREREAKLTGMTAQD